jgi:hypothetical protein
VKSRDLLESDIMSDEAATTRATWRADEEEWSWAALEHWEHQRTLVDVLRDCMLRGDTARFAFGDVSWSGTVVAVGVDVVRVEVDPFAVDIRVSADAPFVLRTRPHAGPGRRGDGGVTTFVARVRELDGTAVSIGTFGGSVEGTLRVGRDQLRLSADDGPPAYVPTASVWWVRPLVDD